MITNVIDIFDISKAVSYLGGLWVVISLLFGALIYWILKKSFWRQFTINTIDFDHVKTKNKSRSGSLNSS